MKKGSTIEFNCAGKIYNGIIHDNYVNHPNCDYNSAVFQELGIEDQRFEYAEKYYQDVSRLTQGQQWPEYASFEDLERLLLALIETFNISIKIDGEYLVPCSRLENALKL